MASPKERFLQNIELAKQWAAISNSAMFEAVCDAAILEFVENQGRSPEGQSAIASHFSLTGAKDLRRILTTLSQAAEKRVPTQFGQLNQ